MGKGNLFLNPIFSEPHRSGTLLGALIGIIFYPILCVLLFIGVKTENLYIISVFIRFKQPMFYWVFKFWDNTPMWFVEHFYETNHMVPDAQILKSKHITLGMFEKIMDHDVSEVPWKQNPVLLNLEFLRAAFINNPNVYASYDLDEVTDVMVQQDAAENMKFVLNSYNVIARMTNPEALKTVYRKFEDEINLPRTYIHESKYYWIAYNLIVNPETSDETVEATLSTKFGSFYNTLEALILRPTPLTITMLTHLAGQENIVDIIFEFTREKRITVTLPVLIAGYASSLNQRIERQEESKRLIVNKLEVNNWGASLNFLLNGQGYEKEKLETLPNSWKESLLPTVFPYIKPGIKVGF